LLHSKSNGGKGTKLIPVTFSKRC